MRIERFPTSYCFSYVIQKTVIETISEAYVEFIFQVTPSYILSFHFLWPLNPKQ